LPVCKSVDPSLESIVKTIRCDLGDTVVWYDEWDAESQAGQQREKLSKSSVIQIDTDGTWWNDANPEDELGWFIAYTDNDGQAWIDWTVFGRPISGMAMRADGDLDALRQWWGTTGSQH